MINLFRKRVHAPIVEQRKELDHYPPEIRDLALNGPDCDALPNATGDFGRSSENPIPVNGVTGTLRYFWKLRLPSGPASYFHRICSAHSKLTSQPIDVYETVSVDATHWDVLFFDIYHPRRSNVAPRGFYLFPYDKRVGDIPSPAGVTFQLESFPHDLPNALPKDDWLEAYARRCERDIARYTFRRPNEHLARLRDLRVDPINIVTVSDGLTLFRQPPTKR
ncbi:MAG: hypothetical protein ABI992_10570 [Chthoniobacterales bacterium]